MNIWGTRGKWVNSSAPRKCWNNFINLIFQLVIQNSSLGTFYEIGLRWVPQNPLMVKSTVVQVMAWYHQASHYLNHVDADLCHHMASLGHKVLTFMVNVFWGNIITRIYLHFLSFLHNKMVRADGNFICGRQTLPRKQGSRGQHGAHLGPVGPRWAPCTLLSGQCCTSYIVNTMAADDLATQRSKTSVAMDCHVILDITL